jgi:DNA segregation ATPase FtsK/SpoIIIE-like protein
MARAIKTTEYIRHTYTSEERLKMGDELAGAHNRLAAIDDEEAVVKSKFKERKATVEQTINSLSRDLANGWTMANVECSLRYGYPNPLEVSYFRIDTGELVKTRAMNQDELQEELPLTDREGEVAVIPPEKSAENVIEFFKHPEPEIMMEGLPEASEPEHAPSEEPEPIMPADPTDPESVQAAQKAAQAGPGDPAAANSSLLKRAAAIFRRLGKPSVSALQRELRLSYKQAVALMDELNGIQGGMPEP